MFTSDALNQTPRQITRSLKRGKIDYPHPYDKLADDVVVRDE